VEVVVANNASALSENSSSDSSNQTVADDGKLNDQQVAQVIDEVSLE
jgi:hypothetical protein